MELSWPMKLRIAAAAAIGVILIGLIAWPLVKPIDPFTLASIPPIAGIISLLAWAFMAAFIAYFICWPYGKEIAPLAVPAGMAIWAVKSANIGSVMQTAPTAAQRLQILLTLKWQGFFWLAVVVVGLFATQLAHFILKPKLIEPQTQSQRIKLNLYFRSAIALVASLLIAKLLLPFLAQDIRIFEAKLGSVIAQPHTAQIVYAVIISFGVAAFLVKILLGVSYIFTIIASAVTTTLAITDYAKPPILEQIAKSSPAIFFPNALVAISPIQMVTFAALGAIAGFWLAVRYNYWRKHSI